MKKLETRYQIETSKGRVSVVCNDPQDAIASLVVAPGAGSTLDHPFLEGFTASITDHSISTLRFNFLYKERGRTAPDPEATLREVWLAAFEEATVRSKGAPAFAGGKSLGGRIASMCVADGMPASGLVFLGYPLHPPGKPERIRDAHLPRIQVPMLFIQGTKDPFAKPELLHGVLKALGDRAEFVPIEGGDHSFRVRGKKLSDQEIGVQLAEPAAEFIRGVTEGRR